MSHTHQHQHTHTTIATNDDSLSQCAAINDVLEKIKNVKKNAQVQQDIQTHRNQPNQSYLLHEIRDPHGILELLRFMDGGLNWNWGRSRL